MRVGVTAIALACALLFSSLPAMAASQLSGVNVVPERAGGARVLFTFVGGVPPGWTVVGAGTQTPTVLLPATTAAPSVNQLAFAGSGGVSSVSVAQSNGSLVATLHLTSPLQLTSRSGNGLIVIDVAGPKSASPAPAAPAAPAVQNGSLSEGQNYEVVPLKYADVSEVVGLLVQGQQIQPNDTFNPEGSIFSLPTTSNGIPTQSGGSPFSNSQTQQSTSFGERVNDNIGFDRRLNAIILYGTPEQIGQYKSFIATIDVPVPSVMLECEVIELNQTGAKDLGLDLTSGAGGPIASAAAGLGPLDNTTTTYGTVGSPNVTSTLQAQLFATISHGGGKILATPRVLALNGSNAQILSGNALPIVSTTVIGGGSPITQTNVNYIAVGINMQIQPRIDPGGYVTSHIYAEISSVTQYISLPGQQVPQVSLRQVSTQAVVKDGQPFVVGGLLLDEEITSLSKIPGIGDLPLIGGLFRVRHDSLQRSNLYIFITPHIIAVNGVQNPGTTPRSALPQTQIPGPMPYYTPAATATPVPNYPELPPQPEPSSIDIPTPPPATPASPRR
jgi:general secretion pathway protein D